MQREIYEVRAVIVDSNGTYNQLTGYPKTFDSKSYQNDIKKAERRAFAELSDIKSGYLKRDDRQIQFAQIIRLSDGMTLETFKDGRLEALPDTEEA